MSRPIYWFKAPGWVTLIALFLSLSLLGLSMFNGYEQGSKIVSFILFILAAPPFTFGVTHLLWVVYKKHRAPETFKEFGDD